MMKTFGKKEEPTQDSGIRPDNEEETVWGSGYTYSEKKQRLIRVFPGVKLKKSKSFSCQTLVSKTARTMIRSLLLFQGIFYLLTGI